MFSKDWTCSLPAHKVFVIDCWNQVDEIATNIGIWCRVTRKTDHAGISLGVECGRLGIGVSVHDVRHWDETTNTWAQ